MSTEYLSANQLVVRDHDDRFEATCRSVRVRSASLLYMTYGTDVAVSRHHAAVRGRHRGSLTGTRAFGQRLGRT
jgi:hypothetical protein